MRGLFIFLLFSVLSFTTQAYPDFAASSWHKGAIVLNSHEVVRGKIKYDDTHDMVLFQLDGKILTFAASQVIYFYYIDNTSGVPRHFKALPYYTRLSRTYQRDYFFEIILGGKVNFLRKANKKVRFINSVKREKYFPHLNINEVCYDYFMLYDDKVVEVNNFSEDALPLLARETSQSIYDYIEAKNITKFTLRNQVALIHFYNLMQQQSEDIRLVQKVEIGR